MIAPNNLPGDEQLARAILTLVDESAPTDDHSEHPDESMLAQLVAGTLDEAEHAELAQHLAECPECRQTASLALRLGEELGCAGPATLPARTRRAVLSGLITACAASLLLILGWRTLVNMPARAERRAYDQAVALLREKRFDAAEKLVAHAVEQGVVSDRLCMLGARAIRRMTGPSALAFSAQLPDFGFGIGGVVSRAATETATADRARRAYELLSRAGDRDLTVHLDRGHALLTLNRPEEARIEFRKASAAEPSNPLAWLGQGLASYALDDYAAAEREFRAALRLDPANVSARMNLAMTLEEEGMVEPALAAWKSLLLTPLPDARRRAIEAEIRDLERQAKP